MRVLLIGYGNPSRRDDGVGWFVAARVRDRELPGVEVLTAHQLEVEHAETIAGFEDVVFVDAAAVGQPGTLSVKELQPRIATHAITHYLTPEDVLGLSFALFGARPRALLLSVVGVNFDFGEDLSPPALAGAERAIQFILHRLSLSGMTA